MNPPHDPLWTRERRFTPPTLTKLWRKSSKSKLRPIQTKTAFMLWPTTAPSGGVTRKARTGRPGNRSSRPLWTNRRGRKLYLRRADRALACRSTCLSRAIPFQPWRRRAQAGTPTGSQSPRNGPGETSNRNGGQRHARLREREIPGGFPPTRGALLLQGRTRVLGRRRGGRVPGWYYPGFR